MKILKQIKALVLKMFGVKKSNKKKTTMLQFTEHVEYFLNQKHYPKDSEIAIFDFLNQEENTFHIWVTYPDALNNLSIRFDEYKRKELYLAATKNYLAHAAA